MSDADRKIYSLNQVCEIEEKAYQKGKADAINEYVTRFEAENITDANAERLKPFIYEMHRLAEQMQKEQTNGNN